MFAEAICVYETGVTAMIPTESREHRMRANGAPGVAAASASVFFGASVVATRFVIAEIDPLSLACLRYLIAVACVAPIVLLTRRYRVAPADLGPIAGLGVLFFGLFPLTFSAALKYTFASRGALILATMPALTLMLATMLRFESLTPLKVLGVSLTFVGVGAAVWETPLETRMFHGIHAGDLLMVLTALCGALYNVLSRPYLRKYPALTVTSYSMLAGTLSLVPLAAMNGLFATLPSITGPGWFAVLFLGVCGGAMGFSFWIWALQKMTPTRVAVFVNLNPIIATLLAAWFLSERIGGRFLLGLLSVLAGIALTNWRGARLSPVSVATLHELKESVR